VAQKKPSRFLVERLVGGALPNGHSALMKNPEEPLDEVVRLMPPQMRVPVCIECGGTSVNWSGWAGYWIADPDNPDEPAEFALYCRECVARELRPCVD
jgi:hypothetical protein